MIPTCFLRVNVHLIGVFSFVFGGVKIKIGSMVEDRFLEFCAGLQTKFSRYVEFLQVDFHSYLMFQ